MSCPACGATVPAGGRFCASCGHRLDGRADERRVVTVLFADLVGFTTLSERRDPEQVKRLVDRCFGWLVADIVGFGGQVDKIIGDAIVALFGAPTAHEDDPERAVRAALRMQATLDERSSELDDVVQMRIGVNTGEVLVGALQAGGDYTAMGDVVNIASRLQTAATPGEVLVGPGTYAATRRCLQYEPKGLFNPRGREAPVDAYRAVAAYAPPGDRTNRPRVPMVGRAAEMELLSLAVDTALAQPRAAFVMLAGDAGMGKSRLANELTAGIAQRHNALSLEGRCLPYGEANVWWPVAEALRHAAGIERTDDIETLRDKLAGLVALRTDSKPDASEVSRIVTGLSQFLGLDGSERPPVPDRAREDASAALVSYLQAAASRRPVVIQLADLHWADEAVLELGQSLLEGLSRCPFVLVATARRSVFERWSPPAGRYDSMVINLEPLNREASAHLVRSLVGDERLAPDVEAAILERGGGNPFFLEELVTLLKEQTPSLERSADTIASTHSLPDTLRGLLTARLDRLGPVERNVVQNAAVIGRRGRVEWLEIMSRKVDGQADISAALDELVARDLIVREGDLWSFRSDLLREVAYHTLPKVERAKRHLGTARWIEEHHQGEWTDGEIDQLAHHFGQAVELATDLGGLDEFTGEVAERALHWLERASMRAEQLRTLPVAARLYDEALTLAEDCEPARRLPLLLGRARVAAESRDLARARHFVERARELAVSLNDRVGEASAFLVEGDIEQKAGDIEAAVDLLDRAVASFDAAGDGQGHAEALRTRGMAELFGGRYGEAQQSAREALAAFEDLGDRRNAAWVKQNLGWIAFISGRTAEAEAWLLQAQATFHELREPAGEAWAEGLLAYVRFQQGDVAEAERLQRKVLEGATSGGDRWATGMMLILGGLLALWAGRTEEAVARSEEARAIFRDLDDIFGVVRASWVEGKALVMSGRLAEGFGLLEQSKFKLEGGASNDEAALATGALAATAVQVGDPRRALQAMGIDPDQPAWDTGELGTLAGVDQLIAGALAAVQLGHHDCAVEWITHAQAAAGADGDGHLLSARALIGAAVGADDEGPDGVQDLIRRVLEGRRVTYLDRLTARFAAAIAAARHGDPDRALAEVVDAKTEADSTGDRVAQAVVRLAEARVRSRADDDGTADAMAEAWARLDALGIEASGWAKLFDRALGAAPGAPLTV